MKSTDSFFFFIRLHQFVIVKLRIASLFSIINPFGSTFFSRSAVAGRETRLGFSFSVFFLNSFFYFSFLYCYSRSKREKQNERVVTSRRNDVRGGRIIAPHYSCCENASRGSITPVLRTSSTNSRKSRPRCGHPFLVHETEPWSRSIGSERRESKGSRTPAIESLRRLYTSDFEFRRKSWRDRGRAIK